MQQQVPVLGQQDKTCKEKENFFRKLSKKIQFIERVVEFLGTEKQVSKTKKKASWYNNKNRTTKN